MKLSVAAVALIICVMGVIISLNEKPRRPAADRVERPPGAAVEAASEASSARWEAGAATPLPISAHDEKPLKISRDAFGHLHCFFPEKESIGRVVVAEPTIDPMRSSEEFECQGEQVMPWGKKLGFYPTITTAGSKARMQSLAAVHFHSCTLPKMDKSKRHEASTALIYMRPWRGLERLDTSDYSALDDSDLMIIKNYPDLNQMAIDCSEIDCKTLMESKILPRLHVLALTIPPGTQYMDSGNLVHILERLSKTGKLDELNLSGQCILPMHLEEITKMHKLRKLTLDDSGADNIGCQVLTRLDKLEQFSAKNCLLDSLAIPYFQELAKKSLKTLDLRSSVFTSQVRKQYRRALPKVKLL